ncbi:hypothetical protein N9E50_01655 [Alphaproteobacteria bacterium]|nr:hypothetical protein [Alphaproteobacteria bacterium]
MRNIIDIMNLHDGKLFINNISLFSDLSGILLIILCYFILFYFLKKNKTILLIISFSYFMRILIMLIGYYLFPLPESLWDSRAFEYYASLNSTIAINEIFTIISTNYLATFYNLLALVYKITGRSPLVLLAILNFISVITIIIISNCSYNIWKSENAKIKTLILLSIMPVNILYSVSILREVLIVFFMSLSILMLINYINSNRYIYIYLSIFLFSLNIFFHAPLLVGLIPIIIIFLIQSFKDLFRGIINGTLKIAPVFNSILILFILYSAILFSWEKAIYSHFITLNIIDQLVIHAKNTYTAGASFPLYILPTNNTELLYLLPLRMIYFLFSPFPWDISKPIHLFGFLDAFITLLIFYFLIKNFREIIMNKNSLLLLFIFLSILVIYSLGTGNFGTAIRHKYKFLFIIIILTSMFFPNIKFRTK